MRKIISLAELRDQDYWYVGGIEYPKDAIFTHCGHQRLGIIAEGRLDDWIESNFDVIKSELEVRGFLIVNNI